MSVIIKEVSTKKQLKEFVKFPLQLYKNCPYFVPQLNLDCYNLLDTKKNPSYEFSESKCFLAYKDDKIVGRIAGIINHKSNKIWGEHCRFSFIDFIDDYEVSAALFNAVEEYARKKNLPKMQGPLSFTDFDNEGLLIEGFDSIPTITVSYNYEYYQHHFEKAGYAKCWDWNELNIYFTDQLPEKFIRVGEIVKKKYNVSIKKFKSRKELRKYVPSIFQLFNRAYEPLHGYTELSPKQIDAIVKQYVPILKLDFVTVVVNEDDKIIGCGISMPSLSKAMQKAKGKMFPFGWYHLLKALYTKPKIGDTVDLYLIAVEPEYQRTGINSLLFLDLGPIYYKQGYRVAETNLILEDNLKNSNQWDNFENKRVRTRRCFEKNL
ncbi:hypothetical protein FACS1894153_2110 [Bacteroidia bacterium]|nr:hypothetical protein FACS1894153_2110 [Bacteroidia bacterium]